MANITPLSNSSNNYYVARQVTKDEIDLLYIDEINLCGTSKRGLALLLDTPLTSFHVCLETLRSQLIRDFNETTPSQRLWGLDRDVKARTGGGLKLIAFFSSEQVLNICFLIMEGNFSSTLKSRAKELNKKLAVAGMNLGVMLEVAPEKLMALVEPAISKAELTRQAHEAAIRESYFTTNTEEEYPNLLKSYQGFAQPLTLMPEAKEMFLHEMLEAKDVQLSDREYNALAKRMAASFRNSSGRSPNRRAIPNTGRRASVYPLSSWPLFEIALDSLTSCPPVMG